jgi:hypothetical protein
MAEEEINQAGTKATKGAPPEAVSKQKIMTPEEFLTKAPLYVVARVDDFHAPNQISFECDGDCAKETTWYKAYGPATVGQEREGEWQIPDYAIKSVAYKCFRCNKRSLTVIYREMEKEKRGSPSVASVLVGVMKLGQYPEPSVALPKALEKNLGKDAAVLYRKGLVSRNSGFGLAAAVYMRRVVEDKTNELIEVAAQLAESHNVDAVTVAEMRATANSTEYTPYEDKLKIAATVFPDSLKVGSMNPLKTLYNLVSKGIHGLNESECIEIADQTTDVFDFIFTNLRAEVTDRKAFAEKVRKLYAP